MRKENNYNAYDYDRLTPGHELKLEHSVYNDEKTDLSDLISKPIDKVMAMREKNLVIEQAAYEKVRDTAKEWEKTAAVTGLYDRAIEFLKTPAVTHTANKWVYDKNDRNTISNMVYEMTYDIYKRSSWHSNSEKWDVRWSIYTNRPDSKNSYRIARQEKTCSSKAEAEKYIQGRIKAYAHLFTEISPPIPEKYVNSFKVYGHLLPGYTTEAMQKELQEQQPEKPIAAEKKPSVRKQLDAFKEQTKDVSASNPAKKRSAPEIE